MHSHWRYPNLTILVLSLVIAILMIRYGLIEGSILTLSAFSYFGVFLAGALFVSTFTIAPATAALFVLSQDLNPMMVAIIGGFGAMIGDYIAFRFLKDRLFEELNPLLKTLHIYRPVTILHSRYFAWLAPVTGALIIASPLPDELGLSLLGLTKINTGRFLLLAFGLNTAGIFLIALAARAG